MNAKPITSDEELEARVEELEAVEDLEEQGYQAGPIVAYITKVPVQVIRDSISTEPFPDEANQARDKGLRRWCEEQLAQQVVFNA